MTCDLASIRDNLTLLKARVAYWEEDAAFNQKPTPESFVNAKTLIADSLAQIDRLAAPVFPALAELEASLCKPASL